MKKIYIFKHYPPLPHSFGPGTFALKSHTYKPLFEKMVDPPLDFYDFSSNSQFLSYDIAIFICS